jgi:hypothetical protein
MVVHYYGPPRTVFGEERERFEIQISGTIEDGMIDGEVIRPEKEQYALAYRLTKRMDLPND